MAKQRRVLGAEKVSARLGKLRKDIRATMTDGRIPKLLLRRHKDRFNKQLDPDEKKWEASAPATLARKRRGSRRKKVLHDSLRLKNAIAIVRQSSLFTNTGAAARIGVNDPLAAAYGRFHQRGEGFPQRRFLGVGRTDVAAVDLLLKNAIIRANRLKVTR